jgi:hypothetical protein
MMVFRDWKLRSIEHPLPFLSVLRERERERERRIGTSADET